MLCNIAFTLKIILSFPGIFREISGEIFQKFSEFQKLPRNFPEIFLEFPIVYNNKNIDLRAVPMCFYVKTVYLSGKFSDHFPGSFKIYKKSPERICYTWIYVEFTVCVLHRHTHIFFSLYIKNFTYFFCGVTFPITPVLWGKVIITKAERNNVMLIKISSVISCTCYTYGF